MDTVPQDAFATLELSEEGGEGLTGLARALLEADCVSSSSFEQNVHRLLSRLRTGRAQPF